MLQLNPRYEAIFNPDNIDQDCDEIASLMNVEADFIKKMSTTATLMTCIVRSTRCNGYTRRYRTMI